jgi:hypothetical protein
VDYEDGKNKISLLCGKIEYMVNTGIMIGGEGMAAIATARFSSLRVDVEFEVPRGKTAESGRCYRFRRPKRFMFMRFNLLEGGRPYEQIKIYSRVAVDVSMTAETPKGSASPPDVVYSRNLFYVAQ